MRHNVSFLLQTHQGQESRRSSEITCCSTDSSYLERRCSAVTLGLTPTPTPAAAAATTPSRRQSASGGGGDTWDYYYPGIQIIHPTPKTSPVPSEKSGTDAKRQPPMGAAHIRPQRLIEQQESYDSISVYSLDEKIGGASSASMVTPLASSPVSTASTIKSKLVDSTSLISCSAFDRRSHQQQQQSASAAQPHHHIIRRAPLASLSSFKISSIDYQDSDLKSLGSDSVFAESYADTDDEMEQFSTDTDELSDAESPPNTRTVSSATGRIGVAGASRRSHQMNPQLTTTTITTASTHLSSGADGSCCSSSASTTASRSAAAPHTAPASVGGPVNRCFNLSEQRHRIGGHRGYASVGGRALPKSRSVLLGSGSAAAGSNTFETKAIIERHSQHQQQQEQQKQLQSVAIVSSNTSSSGGDGGETLMASNSTLRRNSFQAATIGSGVGGGSSSSSGGGATRPVSYSGGVGGSAISGGTCQNSLSNYNKNSNQSTNKLKSSECVDINVVVVVDNRPIVSPSVILELPVISTQEIIDVDLHPPIDPSLPPGTSRKWSKETLF